MILGGMIGATVSAAVTSVAGSFVASGTAFQRRAYFVSSNRLIHLDRQAPAVIGTAFRLTPVGEVVRIDCFGGETISFILATGEVDGVIWFTAVG